MTSEALEPVLAGVRNFRDVGGLPTADGRRVRYGVLYRSGHLARATAEDAEFLTGLGLHTVYDFRNEADQVLDGLDVPLPGVRNVNIPLTDPAHGAEFWQLVREGAVELLRAELADGQAVLRMQESYRDIIRSRTAEHSRVLHDLAGGGVPVLMHCAAGKDRAGLSVAITLLALGVEREAIQADYLLSNDPHRRYPMHRGGADGRPGHSGGQNGIDPEVRELLKPFFDARVEYLAAAYATITEEWGDVDTYLRKGLRISDDTRDALRARLLD
ncbi:tyrosine-protein phosphatase [Streptomyces sp. WMMC897]|nr:MULTISPECIES: tyrosine-protein phosphatase [unclassified Streptomyces]MCZ7415767.1 tyrosine-protein phosphatase [Streptomyces sp. WMMC897]MCZ7434422.1 tyrosine-protein phosphatase [Streptomyces sp. WMMC1477]